MREFAPQGEVNLPFDAAPDIWVLASHWHCPRCDPGERGGKHTTVVWIGKLGRCTTCGQKLNLADPFDKHVPSLDEQLGAAL